MHILILNYEYPPLGGGAGVISQHHAEGLLKLGHHITIVTTWFHEEKEIEVKDNMKIYRLKSLRKSIYASNPFEMLSWITKSQHFLNKHMIKNHFDICLSHFAIPGGVVALSLKKKFKLPYVIVSHGQDIPWFFPKQMFMYHLICYYWLKRIFLHSEKNIVQTQDMKDKLYKFLGEKHNEKNYIIPNGCNYTTPFSTYNTSKIFKIIFVGRLVTQKDPFTFLKSIKLFSNEIDNFVVHIIGDGELQQSMERFVNQNKLSEKIHFLGWLSKKDLFEEYKSAHLQIAPSIAEGMSIALLESLSHGVYVISTKVSGNSEMITESVNGELVKYRDYNEVTNRTIKYYKEKYLNNYKIPSDFLENFRKKYSWNGIVEQYESLISSVLQ